MTVRLGEAIHDAGRLRNRIATWTANRTLRIFGTRTHQRLMEFLIDYGMDSLLRDRREGRSSPAHWQDDPVMIKEMPADRCHGRDPAYPNLSCYLPLKHADDCEFMTEEAGLRWRQRAMEAEALVAVWDRYFMIDSVYWRHTLEYAAGTLEASADNGDQYAATQIRAALLSKGFAE